MREKGQAESQASRVWYQEAQSTDDGERSREQDSAAEGEWVEENDTLLEAQASRPSRPSTNVVALEIEVKDE